MKKLVLLTLMSIIATVTFAQTRGIDVSRHQKNID